MFESSCNSYVSVKMVLSLPSWPRHKKNSKKTGMSSLRDFEKENNSRYSTKHVQIMTCCLSIQNPMVYKYKIWKKIQIMYSLYEHC